MVGCFSSTPVSLSPLIMATDPLPYPTPHPSPPRSIHRPSHSAGGSSACLRASPREVGDAGWPAWLVSDGVQDVSPAEVGCLKARMAAFSFRQGPGGGVRRADGGSRLGDCRARDKSVGGEAFRSAF